MSEIIRIPNIENYSLEIVDSVLILTPKNKIVTEEELYKINLCNSIIIDCVIQNGEDIISNKNKYFQLLHDIWLLMPIQKIIQNTTFNIKITDEDGLSGYSWYPLLKISVQRKDANGTIKEIINMVKLNNFSFKIKIKLENEKVISFSYNF